ncbi:hypothetical protein [Hydrogenophaga sp. IBVHS2]|uniref:hypothetical protein n=1 Tax=Hydrogenophaga sp. IBVHS2 TaxID=1985170 RepID=UPI000A2E3CDA|nr:hypothetical protein [Hydrogenophaga sp. IBVHS2]OSZ66031.1 hypothetical protein CAP38_08385 [Hydrogenophaga sp. IBVHS2]
MRCLTLLVPALVAAGGLVAPAAAQTAGPAPSRMAPDGLITYACAVTMPSSAQRIVFVEALDKQAGRRIADRARPVDTNGKRTPVRSVQECIDLAKEKFIDAQSAELLANTPR